MKSILTHVFLLLLCLQVTAQTSIGFKIGTNISKYSSIDGYEELGAEFQSNTGLQAGLAFDFKLSEKISFAPEALFLQKGNTEKYEDDNNNYIEGITKLNYVEIPLLLKYSFFKNEKTTAFLTAGPSLGYLAQGKYITEYKIADEIEKEESTFEDSFYEGYNRLDVGAMLGIGFGIRLNESSSINLDARYLLGIKDLFIINDDDDNVKNRGIGITLGYLYSF